MSWESRQYKMRLLGFRGSKVLTCRLENKELLKMVDDLARNVFGIAQFKGAQSRYSS